LKIKCQVTGVKPFDKLTLKKLPQILDTYLRENPFDRRGFLLYNLLLCKRD